MIARPETIVRTATQQDRQALANLIHFETHVHRHLDWRAPLDWLGYSPYLVVEKQGRVQAVLVAPPDPPQVAWIRLFAVASGYPLEEAWFTLWPAALADLHDLPGVKVAAIPLQPWFLHLLEKSHFALSHNVVLLVWQRGRPLPPENKISASIRPMILDDLPEVVKVDWAAFHPLWQNSLDALEIAYRQAAVATVAEEDGQMVGYQISTPSPMGGHLARLAVRPDYQGRGVGYALVVDMLDQFNRRGALRVTVNTQEENVASLSLYQKVGFRRTGETYPVYELQQSENSHETF